MAELFNSLLKKGIKTTSVLVIGKNVLPAVASYHHVIYRAYIMQSRFPCHIVRRLAENGFNNKIAKLDPAIGPTSAPAISARDKEGFPS
ncbi:MAG: hypothetical protein OEW04_06480 [Nitrospirota bacterium]|nr:hypothetical protein [Nitrospirota bacterium]